MRQVIIDGVEYVPKKQIKSLLADAKVGDLCKTDLDEWIQIDDAPEPPSPILYHLDRPFKGNIIHTEPLAPEGSAEWAWQMLKLGKPVTNKWVFTAGGYIKDTDSDKYRFVQMWDFFSDWKLYEEKPEPAKEPEIVAHKQHANCLVCGKEIEGLLDGHATVSIKRYSISSLYESTYSHYCGKCFLELGFDATERELRNRQQPIAEPEPEPKFAVGDWVEFNPGNNPKQVEIVEIDGDKLYYNARYAGKTIKTHIYASAITRKLDPSEVIVNIGCLKGTVKPSIYDDGAMLTDEFVLFQDSVKYATIPLSMLDAPTREMVERLLKAQEEKC